MKKLVFITGTRADYGKLEPLAVEALAAGNDVHFFVLSLVSILIFDNSYHLTETDLLTILRRWKQQRHPI